MSAWKFQANLQITAGWTQKDSSQNNDNDNNNKTNYPTKQRYPMYTSGKEVKYAI